jgi:hypothetical protein
MGDFLYLYVMNYKQIHDSIIDRAKTRVLPKEVYTERHHIIPRCMNGSDDKSNLVDLTAKEHFIVHKLLVEVYPDVDGLVLAYFLFTNGTNRMNHKDINHYKVGAKEYERVKIAYSKILSERSRNIERTQEWKDNISKAQKGKKGRPHSEEWKVNHSKEVSGENHPMYNKKHKDSSKEKMSIAKKGKYTGSKNPNGKKIINTITGEIHDSLQEVATILNVSKPHLCRKINPNNKTKNDTPYKYV